MNYGSLIEHAEHAKKRALAVYSGFPVGAALLTRSGKIYTGINIESSSYGLTCCAERVALFKALSEGERDFTAIAIASDSEEECTPCGACRQVLWDYARDISIVLERKQAEPVILTLSELFPHAFGESSLKHEK